MANKDDSQGPFAARERKVYREPQLVEYGLLSEVTRGGGSMTAQELMPTQLMKKEP